jgi:hypothetical protein
VRSKGDITTSVKYCCLRHLPCRLVAEDANDWGVELTGRQARRRANYTTSCVLKTVMDARLLQEPNGYQLLRELEKLKQTDCRSIAKLMEWVVTGTPAIA